MYGDRTCSSDSSVVLSASVPAGRGTLSDAVGVRRCAVTALIVAASSTAMASVAVTEGAPVISMRRLNSDHLQIEGIENTGHVNITVRGQQ